MPLITTTRSLGPVPPTHPPSRPPALSPSVPPSISPFLQRAHSPQRMRVTASVKQVLKQEGRDATRRAVRGRGTGAGGCRVGRLGAAHLGSSPGQGRRLPRVPCLLPAPAPSHLPHPQPHSLKRDRHRAYAPFSPSAHALWRLKRSAREMKYGRVCRAEGLGLERRGPGGGYDRQAVSYDL